MIIKLDMQDAVPIYEQIRNQIVLGIAAGKLTAGEKLPSVRKLAADLDINFHTVNKAYTALCDEGYLVMDRRKGALIAQPQAGNRIFSEKIRFQIKQAAAEEIAHGMDEDVFIKLCTECYREVKNK